VRHNGTKTICEYQEQVGVYAVTTLEDDSGTASL
jgi:hypothetical protein